MPISVMSARRTAAGAVGAAAIAGAMLFSAVPSAQAAPAYHGNQVAAAGWHNAPMPAHHWHHHHHFWRHWWWWW